MNWIIIYNLSYYFVITKIIINKKIFKLTFHIYFKHHLFFSSNYHIFLIIHQFFKFILIIIRVKYFIII